MGGGTQVVGSGTIAPPPPQKKNVESGTLDAKKSGKWDFDKNVGHPKFPKLETKKKLQVKILVLLCNLLERNQCVIIICTFLWLLSLRLKKKYTVSH